MRENREFRRFNLVSHPEVYDVHTNKLFGNMVDISTGGFKVITRKRLEQGREYLLSIKLPEGTCDSRSVEVKASICWCGMNTDPESFISGCDLVQIDAKGRLDLTALMFADRAKVKKNNDMSV